APEIVVTPTISPPRIAEPDHAGELVAQAGGDMIPYPADQLAQANQLLAPLAHQLSLMQKQMFDQFQQAMMMMFQMFNTLQQDQMGAIRQELDHLHNLTQELTKLQLDLNRRGQATGN